MTTAIEIRDETASGTLLKSMRLEIPSESITVRELIRSRVFQEVKDFNLQPDSCSFRGLVQPTEKEELLNGPRNDPKSKSHIDWEKQFATAIEAFENHQLLVLVKNEQVVKLDQQIKVTPSTQIAFIKLILLVGG